MKPFDYLEARSIKEACSLLAKYKGKSRILAGGTDLLVAMKNTKIAPEYIINLNTVPNLDHINYTKGKGLKIGALVTLDEIENSAIIRKRVPVMAETARQMAVPAIRNVATVAGNICNAAPSADTAPPLIGLGAKVKIAGHAGTRTLALEDFFLGPGKNALKQGEIITEIQIPETSLHMRGTYLKLTPRTVEDLALVGVAAIATLDSGHSKSAKVLDVKVVLGAVAPTPIRARRTEEIIKGKILGRKIIDEAAQTASEEAMPISDVRGSADFRREMVKVLTAQALTRVATAA